MRAKTFSPIASVTLALCMALAGATLDAQTTTRFQGVKANAGTATFAMDGTKRMLTLSDDFVVPDTPAPHWQVVDASGHAYLLQRLKIKEDKLNKTIEVPAHVREVAKVQIWCSFAETLLGEASFAQPVGVLCVGEPHVSTAFAGVKANKGTVAHLRRGSESVLTLSADFVVPDTPAPHWQVVDSQGNTYLLQRLKVKGDKLNQTIVLPSYVPDVAKVQIWCAFAQTLLGEASFEHPVM